MCVTSLMREDYATPTEWGIPEASNRRGVLVPHFKVCTVPPAFGWPDQEARPRIVI
jgi:hypothetical protein